MVKLPEEIRSNLYRLVRNLSLQEAVSGVGLFGSWSRGDAVSSSDVDLLIISNMDFNYEYAERLELKGLFIDLNYVPKKWVNKGIPPEIDQKLYEANVLYDRDWSLTSIRDWMQKSYRSLERLNIRTEAYLVESDIYLSRATSAHSRNDFQSAYVFANLSLDSMLKICLEACSLPICQSRFVSALKQSAEKLGMPELFTRYVSLFRFGETNRQEMERKLVLFKSIWETTSELMRNNVAVTESMHFKVKNKLKYYGSNGFLKGMMARVNDIIGTEDYVEATHYIFPTLIDILENYAWLKSATDSSKLDYTALFRSLKGLKRSPTQVYEKATEVLQIQDMSQKTSEETIKQAKEIILNVGQKRRQLIGSLN